MNDQQMAAWLARGHKALLDTVPPRTRKQFAGLMLDAGLWSASRLSLDSAVARVGDCLHPERGGGQSFKVSEVWLWMRETGHCALFEAMGEDLGRRTDPIPNEERQQALLSRIDDRLASIVAELEDLQALRTQITRDPDSLPAKSGGSAVRFSRDVEGF